MKGHPVTDNGPGAIQVKPFTIQRVDWPLTKVTTLPFCLVFPLPSWLRQRLSLRPGSSRRPRPASTCCTSRPTAGAALCLPNGPTAIHISGPCRLLQQHGCSPYVESLLHLYARWSSINDLQLQSPTHTPTATVSGLLKRHRPPAARPP